MTKSALIIGAALILLGFIGYITPLLSKGEASKTALIPAGFGVAIYILGRIAVAKESARKHLMHLALLVALVGTIGGIQRLFKANLFHGGEINLAIVSQFAMAVLCLAFVVGGVRSFINARKSK